MFAFLDSPVEIGIIVLVVLLLFGGSQLPKLAKNLGQAQKEFKDGLSAGQKADDGHPVATEVTKTTTTTVPVAPLVPPVATPATATADAQRAEELRLLEARMAELKGEQPRSTEI
jgi:sec-independent protein translocase protein TatA